MNSQQNIEVNDGEFDEFIFNPSPLSQFFKDKLKLLYQKKMSSIDSKSFLKRTISQINLLVYLKFSHPKFINYLIENEKKLNSLSLKILTDLFMNIQDKLIFNNLALSFFYLKNKNEIDKKTLQLPYSLEERSKLLLKKIVTEDLPIKIFKKEFGHYSLNNYELSERRFSEYSQSELKKMGSLLKNAKIKHSGDNFKLVDQFIDNPISNQDIYSNLLIIRELSKYVSVKIIAILRKKILKVSKNEKINNPFQYTWKELMRENSF